MARGRGRGRGRGRESGRISPVNLNENSLLRNENKRELSNSREIEITKSEIFPNKFIGRSRVRGIERGRGKGRKSSIYFDRNYSPINEGERKLTNISGIDINKSEILETKFIGRKSVGWMGRGMRGRISLLNRKDSTRNEREKELSRTRGIDINRSEIRRGGFISGIKESFTLNERKESIYKDSKGYILRGRGEFFLK